jgi:hypothetical protein
MNLVNHGFKSNYAEGLSVLQEITGIRGTSTQQLIFYGYWRDDLNIHRRIIEKRNCSNCHQSLKYLGFANLDNYLAFGVCAECGAENLFAHLSDISLALKDLSTRSFS